MTYEEIVEKVKVGDYILTTDREFSKDKSKVKVKVGKVDNSVPNGMAIAAGPAGYWLRNTSVYLYKQIYLGGE